MKRKPIKGEEMEKKTSDNEESMGDDEMEDEEKACGTKKSVEITEDDLMKSVHQLEDFAKSDDPISRKNELLEKAQTDDLTASEKDELFKALGGPVVEDEEEEEEESVTKGLTENEDMQKSLDVSEFLSEQHTELVKALGGLEDKINSSDSRQHEFNILLAKSMARVGKLVKSLSGRMEVIEEQPVGKPRSTAKPLQKAFGGQEQAPTLTKSQVMDQLVNLAMNGSAPPDVSMEHVIAKFESSNILDKRVKPLLNLGQTVN